MKAARMAPNVRHPRNRMKKRGKKGEGRAQSNVSRLMRFLSFALPGLLLLGSAVAENATAGDADEVDMTEAAFAAVCARLAESQQCTFSRAASHRDVVRSHVDGP